MSWSKPAVAYNVAYRMYIVRTQITHDVTVVLTKFCKQIFHGNRLEAITATFDECAANPLLLFGLQLVIAALEASC